MKNWKKKFIRKFGLSGEDYGIDQWIEKPIDNVIDFIELLLEERTREIVKLIQHNIKKGRKERLKRNFKYGVEDTLYEIQAILKHYNLKENE